MKLKFSVTAILLIFLSMPTHCFEEGVLCSQDPKFLNNHSIKNNKSILDKYACTSKVNYWISGQSILDMGLKELNNYFTTCSCIANFHKSSPKILSKSVSGNEIARIIDNKNHQELDFEFDIYKKLSTVSAADTFFETTNICTGLIDTVNSVTGCSDVLQHESPDFFDMISRLSDGVPNFGDNLRDLARRTSFSYFRLLAPGLRDKIKEIDLLLKKDKKYKKISNKARDQKRNDMIEESIKKLVSESVEKRERDEGVVWPIEPSEKKHILSTVLTNDTFRKEIIERFTKRKRWFTRRDVSKIKKRDRYKFVENMFKKNEDNIKGFCNEARLDIEKYCKYKLRPGYQEANSYFNAVSCELLRRDVNNKYGHCKNEVNRKSNVCIEFNSYLENQVQTMKKSGEFINAKKYKGNILDGIDDLMTSRSFASNEQVRFAKSKFSYDHIFSNTKKKIANYKKVIKKDKLVNEGVSKLSKSRGMMNSDSQLMRSPIRIDASNGVFKDNTSTSSSSQTSSSALGKSPNNSIIKSVPSFYSTAGDSSFQSSNFRVNEDHNLMNDNVNQHSSKSYNETSSKPDLSKLMDELIAKEKSLNEKDSSNLRDEISRLKANIATINKKRNTQISSNEGNQKLSNEKVENHKQNKSLNPSSSSYNYSNNSSVATYSNVPRVNKRTVVSDRNTSSTSGAFSSSNNESASVKFDQSGTRSNGVENNTTLGLTIDIPDNAKIFTYKEFNSPNFKPNAKYFYVRVNGKLEVWEINPHAKNKSDRYIKVNVSDQTKVKISKKDDGKLKGTSGKDQVRNEKINHAIASHKDLVNLLDNAK